MLAHPEHDARLSALVFGGSHAPPQVFDLGIAGVLGQRSTRDQLVHQRGHPRVVEGVHLIGPQLGAGRALQDETGDDTTAVVGDIMYRFRIPIVGIVDGDEDALVQNGHFAPGSVRLTVAQDDEFGLAVRAAVFEDRNRVDLGFAEVRDRVLELAAPELLERVDY